MKPIANNNGGGGGGGSPTGPAGGDLAATYPNPNVAAVHSAGTQLTIGTIADGQTVVRSGANLIGVTASGTPTGPAGGDLSGTYPNPAVAKIQGVGVAVTAPTANQVLEYNSGTSKWTPTNLPASLPPSGAAGGDLNGTYPNPGVARIQGIPVSITAPTANQVLEYNSGTGQWTPNDLPAALPPTGPAGGDLSGTYPNPVVAQLQTFPVNPTAPSPTQTLIWDGSQWTPTDPVFHSSPFYTVGNRANGDTDETCDVLDDGDGVRFRSLLSAVHDCDIWVRPGTYDTRAGDSGAGPYIVQNNIRVRGAGSGQTVFIGGDKTDLGVFQLDNGCSLEDVAVQSFARDAVDSIHKAAITFVNPENNGLVPKYLRNVEIYIGLNGITLDTGTLNAGVAFSDLTGGLVVSKVSVTFDIGSGDQTTHFSNPLDAMIGFVRPVADSPVFNTTPIYFDNCSVNYAHVGWGNYDGVFVVSNSYFLNDNFPSLVGFYQTQLVGRNVFQNCVATIYKRGDQWDHGAYGFMADGAINTSPSPTSAKTQTFLWSNCYVLQSGGDHGYGSGYYLFGENVVGAGNILNCIAHNCEIGLETNERVDRISILMCEFSDNGLATAISPGVSNFDVAHTRLT